jgi:hypothetical protein
MPPDLTSTYVQTWYFGTRPDFLDTPSDRIANQLAGRAADESLEVEYTQAQEWNQSIEVLQESLDDRIAIIREALQEPACEAIRDVILEFDFRRRGLRMDCVLLGDGVLFVSNSKLKTWRRSERRGGVTPNGPAGTMARPLGGPVTVADQRSLAPSASTSKTGYLRRLGLRGEPVIQSVEGARAGRETPEWAAYLMYIGYWMSDHQEDGATLNCVVTLPTRSCAAALVAFGALLHSATEPCRVLTWSEVQMLEAGAPIFLRMADKRGKKRTHAGRVRQSAFPGMVQIEVDEPKHTHWITVTNFEKFEVRLTEHETSPRSTRAGSVLTKAVPSFTSDWIHAGRTCCAVITNQARWRNEVASIAMRAGRESATLADFFSSSNPDEVTRVDVLSSKRAQELNCDFVILDGPNAFLQRENVASRRVVILLNVFEFQKYSSEIAGMIAGRDEMFTTELPDPLVDTSVFTVRHL